ncbi:uncharacterized protein LOC124436632 isoform X1 [Xenia sp. Carnegie-2017]|uniref:uncharacterized protein LOC124436632 isoform X1 n=1 Tax=Xenia sp. Carnegie-2017 TaxID=2897299 RepID=UPI001F038083|nr:uncharacterized protein LOC124436632 isoform X1 [Xenia sp. Carnegie-2017]
MTDFERNKRSIASWAIALVFLVVAITTLSIFLDKADDEICRWGKRGYLEYGLVATITTMICLVVMIMINVFKNLKATVYFSTVFLAILLFAAGVVLAVTYSSYNNDKMNTPKANTSFCDWLQKTDNYVSCTYLIVASVFSFLAAVVLIVEFCLTRYIAFVCVPCMLYEEEN